MVLLPDIYACPEECETFFSGVMLKKLIRHSSVANNASEYQTYACDHVFRKKIL
jgi:hypothetical protein